MVTISAPNPMLSPEKIFVGVIKQHAVMMSRSTRISFFSLTPIAQDNGRAEK